MEYVLMDYILVTVKVLAGLALFLLGVQTMGDGLQKVAGERLRVILKKLTSKPIYGVGVGSFITMIIQSSSATTVMLVGFVNAGLLTLTNAMGVIFGANIGTTFTAQLVSFDFMGWAIWLSIALGIGLRMFGQRKQIRFVGEILLGFGILFLGMEIMKDALYFLRESDQATNILTMLSKTPILGLFAGVIFTAIIQSSSATSGIVIALSLQTTASGDPLISLTGAIAVIIGANIGTCVTALIASAGVTSWGAKKVAVAHIMFNLLGGLIFFFLIPISSELISMTSSVPARQIANFHTLFNVSMSMLVLPFTGLFVKLINRIFPYDDKRPDDSLLYLTNNLLQTPSMALAQVSQEMARMLEIARTMVYDSKRMLFLREKRIGKDILDSESVVNSLQHKITAYLVRLTQKSLSLEQAQRGVSFLHVVHDIERIGDHATNIAEIAEDYIENKMKYSDHAKEGMDNLFKLVDRACVISGYALKNLDESMKQEMKQLENHIDEQTEGIGTVHFNEIELGLVKPESGVYYMDMASNLERVGDHCMNIVKYLSNPKKINSQ